MTVETIREGVERRLAYLFVAFSVLPPIFFTLQDFLADQPTSRILARGLPLVAGLVNVAILALNRRDVRELTPWIAGITAAALVISTAARPDAELVPLRGRMLQPMLMFLMLPNSLLRQAGPPVVLSSIFIVLRLWRVENLPPLDFVNDALMLIFLHTAGVLFVSWRIAMERDLGNAWHEQREARLAAEAARAAVRTLEGILPVCAFCKKIHADSNWTAIEQYVSERTEARFSHGLCPTCRVEQYPDFPPASR